MAKKFSFSNLKDKLTSNKKDDTLKIEEEAFDTTIEDLFKKRKQYITKASLMALLSGLIFILMVSLFIYITQNDKPSGKRHNPTDAQIEVDSDIDEANIWQYDIQDKITTLNNKLIDFKKTLSQEAKGTNESLKSGLSEINDRLNGSLDEIRSLLEDQGINIQNRLQSVEDKLHDAKNELKDYTDQSVKRALGSMSNSSTIQVINPSYNTGMLPIPKTLDNSKLKEEINEKLKQASKDFKNLVNTVEKDENIDDETLAKYNDLYTKYEKLANKKISFKGHDTTKIKDVISKYKQMANNYKKIAKDLSRQDKDKYASVIDRFESMAKKYRTIEDKYIALHNKTAINPIVVNGKNLINKVNKKLKNAQDKMSSSLEKMANDFKYLLSNIKTDNSIDDDVLLKYQEMADKYSELSTTQMNLNGSNKEKIQTIMQKYSKLSKDYNDAIKNLESKDSTKYSNIINQFKKSAKKYNEIEDKYDILQENLNRPIYVKNKIGKSYVDNKIKDKLNEASKKLEQSLSSMSKNFQQMVREIETDEKVSDELFLKYSDLYSKYNKLANKEVSLRGSDKQKIDKLSDDYSDMIKIYKKATKDLEKINKKKYASLINKFKTITSEYNSLKNNYGKLKDEINKPKFLPAVTNIIKETRTQTKLIEPNKRIYKDFENLSDEYQKVLLKLENDRSVQNKVRQEYAELSSDFQKLGREYRKTKLLSGSNSDKYEAMSLKYHQLGSGYEKMADDLKSIGKRQYSDFITKYSNLADQYNSMSSQYEELVKQAKEEEKDKFVEITENDEQMFADLEIDTVDQNKYDDMKSTLFSYKEEEEEELGDFHLMTGFAKSILLTGVSAPTFGSGILNPKPVLFSISSELVIANDDSEDLKDCLLIGTATGNMNTERAEIQITKISCSIIDENGRRRKIEKSGSPLGWVIGEDGKYGLKGRLVDSAGKIVMRELSVGFLQGVYSAFSNTGATSSLFGSSGVQGQSAISSGIQVGTSSALSKLADYYEKMLDGMYPFIDIKAGRYVTILFNGGETIEEEKYQRVRVNRDRGYGSINTDMEVNINDW